MQIDPIANLVLIFAIVQVASPSMDSLPCPVECICLSHTQVLCNAGGLTDLPLHQLPPTVERLSFTRNSFPTIPSEAFSPLKALRTLTLDGNNITVLKPFAFRGLPRLQELTIRHTLLDRIARFTFAGLHNLTTIDLSGNRIRLIEEYGFAGGVNLHTILLRNNPLRKVVANAFSGLNGVDQLVMPSGVRDLQPDAFNSLENVGSLRLPFMDLDALKAGTFRGLINVHTLSIEDSDLGVIQLGAFDDLVSVAHLNFVNNKIDGIQHLHIGPWHRVEAVTFRGNHILNVPDRHAIRLVVASLTVVGNHFPCDCHLHELLAGALANATDQFLASNYCISPLEMNGVAIAEMRLETVARCEEPTMQENLEALNGCASHGLSMRSRVLIIVVAFAVSR